MYLKYFLESGIFAQDSKDSESRTLFYFVTDPSEHGPSFFSQCRISMRYHGSVVPIKIYPLRHDESFHSSLLLFLFD